MASAVPDVLEDAGGISSRHEAPDDASGATEPASRAHPVPTPTGPRATISSSKGGCWSSSSSTSDDSDVSALSLEELLTLLAKFQQGLLYLLIDVDQQIAAAAKPQRRTLKRQIKELKMLVTPALPRELGPLFSRKAALYLPIPDRVAVLGQLLLPNPALESIRDGALDREQVRIAVRSLYQTRLDARGVGTVVGFPGMGKTYLLRLLLESQAASTPALVGDAEMESWWRSLPVFVISFNGITSASSEDLALAEFGPTVPGVVRLLHSEMMQTDGSPDFSAFRADVLRLLEAGELAVSILLQLSSYVLETRCRRRMASTDGFVALLLADELVQLSRVSPPSPLRRRRLKRRQSGRTSSPPPASSSSSGPPSRPDARGTLPALTSSDLMPGIGGPAALPFDPAPVSHAAKAALSELCAFANCFCLRLCVSSLSEGFIQRQMATPSGSVRVRIGPLWLVDDARVASAVDRALVARGRGFQVTSQSGVASVLPTEVVGVCLGVLAGGHPRAAVVLINSIEASRDGEPFVGNFLSKLDPDQLSLAASSIDILCAHPIVVAVGLLGYEVDPKRPVCGDMLWDQVYAHGALTRGVLHRADGRTSSSASRSSANHTPTYGTRLSVAFLLEALKRKAASSSRIGPAVDVLLPVATIADEDLYAALQDVRATLETGDAPMAWERFVFSALTAVSQARRLCSLHLSSLVRDGQPQPSLRGSSLTQLFPASPPYVGGTAWLEAAQVDASRAFRDVRRFNDVAELLAKDDEDLLDSVWQANKPNFPAVDGVVFFRCTHCDIEPGPRHGELVAVMLQLKHREKTNLRRDIIHSAVSAAEAFSSSSAGPSWSRRSAFVVLSRRALPPQRQGDVAEAVSTPVLVVDETGLKAIFGPGLHALVRSSAVAFGTQVVDLTCGRFRKGLV
ncbi:hypothetical protein BU14_0352s0025 [Porphyra umbilicalis]|uniref:Uncharacterized protein n=1 Tax=Porphyra umbilicalis TaxID=2786 RepID=A0A1X6NY29_PORUM|nr:hypothetical protein BU14_0352s0025 [Porphyra umbilicalis]|eukprot:OSX73406.1 hypothetical protein BU14_0352s0025 [Porphyra umbilicalis]